MNAIENGLFSLLVGATLVGCASASSVNISPSVSPQDVPGSIAIDEFVPDTSPTIAAQTQNDRTQTVTIYSADTECESLIPQQVELPQSNTLEASVGEIVGRWNNSDFRLAGYRVNVDGDTGVATVDLRVDPDSERQILSLSSCERYALFGSLSETLTSNPQWEISQVRFTDRSEEITF
ncbi:MAG: hypothetical protein SWY16_22850 [Cyanobacteriota bacterium]|nr:hypothetical protein [Cyanobacteriota bacterium]